MENKFIKELLDPVNMKIVMFLLNENYATKKDIEEQVSEISQASLYRHLKKLVKSEILEIHSKNQIRGTYEKTYKLKFNPNEKINEIIENGTKEEIYEIFYTFIMSLLMDFDSYLKKDGYNLKEDKVGFRSFPITLTDEECEEMNEEIANIFKKYVNKKTKNNSTLRKYSIIFIPSERND